MNTQEKNSFFGSKAFRHILLIVLAVILVASGMIGRSKMTLAGEKEAERSAATRQELVEAR